MPPKCVYKRDHSDSSDYWKHYYCYSRDNNDLNKHYGFSDHSDNNNPNDHKLCLS